MGCLGRLTLDGCWPSGFYLVCMQLMLGLCITDTGFVYAWCYANERWQPWCIRHDMQKVDAWSASEERQGSIDGWESIDG